jgi:Asp-tRNA(Asn)/Glu-tRNA(Gln) amidotransferase C subunit
MRIDSPVLEFALQLHHILEPFMRTATLPAVRVSPDTRSLIESVLREDETLSMFIEQTLKQQALRRKEDHAFYAALRRSALVKAGKMKTITAEESIRRLREQLAKKKAAAAKSAA